MHTTDEANTAEIDIYDAGFDLDAEITSVGKSLLKRDKRGHTASILYADPKGAELYAEFIRQTSEDGPQSSSPAQLINKNKAALAEAYKNVDRFVIIGGGDYLSFMHQEAVILEAVRELSTSCKEIEVVLVDVSEHFLNDQVQALHHLGEKIGQEYKIMPIKADFTKVSGDTFDHIMEEHFDAQPRANLMTGIISTGATFGNIEDVIDTDSMPFQKIEERMALIGEFGAPGSIVGFDCFSSLDKSDDYYETRPLRDFFVNGMELIANRGEGVEGLSVRDASGQLLFRYSTKQYGAAALLAHRLEVISPQQVVIHNGTSIRTDIVDGYSMMYSLRPRADHIIGRPSGNTGLQYDSTFGIASGLNFYTFEKVGLPAILNQAGDISLIDPKANPESSQARRPAVAARMRDFIGKLRPTRVGSGRPSPGPAYA